MLRCIDLKRSILLVNFFPKSPASQFHASSARFVRRVLSRNPSGDEKSEDLTINIDLPPKCQDSSPDFFGIESDEGVITLSPPGIASRSPDVEKKSKEKFHRRPFGVVRYDSDNKLKFHGQYNKDDFLFPLRNTEDAEVAQEIQKFPARSADREKTLSDCYESNRNNESQPHQRTEPKGSYIDEFYFSNMVGKDGADHKNNISATSEGLNFIDETYFGNVSQKDDLPDELNYIHKNYDPSLPSSETSFSQAENDEIFVQKKHLFEDSSTSEVPESELNYVDESYFKHLSTVTQEPLSNLPNNTERKIDFSEEDVSEMNATEKFNTSIKSEDTKPGILQETITPSIGDPYMPPFNKYSGNPHPSTPLSGIKNNHFIKSDVKFNQSNEKSAKNSRQQLKPDLQDDYENSSSYAPKNNLISKQKISLKSSINDQTSLSNKSELENKDAASEDPSTAHEFVTKLRKEREVPIQQSAKGEKASTVEKYDSKGFRILTNQVTDLSRFTRDEILKLLTDSVVYSDDNLLILNKPYGLVIHESQTTNLPCLSSFLDDLAKEMDPESTDPKLFTVHRLDKETTGCLLLARTEIMAEYLKSLFVQRKIIKKYWIVTTRVPDPPEGIIDMPIAEGSVDNKKRMVLHAKLPKDIGYRNHSRQGKEAISSYKVISESGNAALVEVCPKTGIKHQIRVHFGFGLSCPILGDHKYSHFDKLAPQKLPSDMLQRLRVRQSKVRHIPMHIHAKSVVIPDYFDGRDLVVNIPIPDHMKSNLKSLKFRKK